MRHSRLLTLTTLSVAFILVLGCGDGSGPSGSSGNPPPDRTPGCVENLDRQELLYLEINGGFGGLEDYLLEVTRDGELIVRCVSGAETRTRLSRRVWNDLLVAREDAHLHELDDRYVGEGADGFEYFLVDVGCSPAIDITTDDYAIPEQLAPLITMLVRIAFDAQPPFDQECRRPLQDLPQRGG